MTPWVLWSMTETDTNAAPVAEDLLDLIDAYAEARHVCGCHLYNAKTAAARNAVVAALASAAPHPNPADAWAEGFRAGVSWRMSVEEFWEKHDYGESPKEPSNPYRASGQAAGRLPWKDSPFQLKAEG